MVLYRSSIKCHALWVPTAIPDPAFDPLYTASAHRRTRTRAYLATPLEYRVDVLGATAPDVVTACGGWLFDRTLAGWQVRVLLADGAGAEPLSILGVTVADLASNLPMLAAAGPASPYTSCTVAVAASLLARDGAVATAVAGAVEHGHAEILTWGEAPDWLQRVDADGLDLRPAHHRLSGAARAFKARALDNVHHSEIAALEHFSCNQIRHVPDQRDLVDDPVHCGAEAIELRRAPV